MAKGVKKFLPGLPRIQATNPFRYDVWKLVNREVFASEAQWQHPMQIVCDIDKTYLESHYETLRGMARIMLENAMDKITVAGARELLRALKFQDHPLTCQAGVTVPLHFVSSSPPQLRGVLEHKIGMDQLSCASNSFKDQIYNLKKAKFSFLKQQVTYKVAAILALASTCTNLKQLILIGDNAESDPYIYTLVKYILTARISRADSIACLGVMGISADMASELFARLECFESKVAQPPQVLITIRLAHPAKPQRSLPLVQDIFWFEHYLHLAMMLSELGYIHPPGLCQFLTESMTHSRLELRWAYAQWQLALTQYHPAAGAYYVREPTTASALASPLLKTWFQEMMDPARNDLASQEPGPPELPDDAKLAPAEFVAAFRAWFESRQQTSQDRT